MAAQNRQGKVLRIGIIQDGNIVQERVIKAGDPVTIGDSPKCTFVLPKTRLPSSEFTLFKPGSGGYSLQFTEDMVGKISSSSSGGPSKPAVIALKALATDPSVTKANGVGTLPLSEHHRGKITIDTVTVLFQFVPPPPVKAVAPIQALDFRPRMIEEDDPVFLGFLGIWSALGIVLAIWVWRTEPRPFTLDDVPQRYVQLIKQPDPQPEPEAPVEDVGKEQKREEETDAQKAMKGAKSDRERAKAEGQRRDEIMNSSAIFLNILGTKGESKGGVVENTWSDEERGLGNVDDALAQAGATTGDASLATRTGNAGGNAASEGRGISQIGGGQGGKVEGPRVSVKPRVTSGSGSVKTVSGDTNQVAAAIKKYTGQLQYCYEKELKVDPTLEGRIEIGWAVSGGVVTGMPRVISNDTDSGALADCVMKKVRRWTFPVDVEGDMSYPFLFKPK